MRYRVAVVSDTELLDFLDDNGRTAGVATRSEVHRDGLWHRTLHLWLACETAGERSVLFQLRGESVADSPGLLDVSVAGHLLAGETYIDGLREVREEIGISVPPDAVVSLGVRRDVGPAAGGGVNRELQGVHMAKLDPAWGAFALMDQEAAGIYWVSNEAGLRLHRGQITTFDCDALIPVDGVLRPQVRHVTAASFVRRAGYYEQIHLVAEALLTGAQLPLFVANA